MIKHTQAKIAFTTAKEPTFWFGCKHNINPYRGCEHHCIYCDSRSQCYHVEQFDEVVEAKMNMPELLKSELAKKRSKGIMGFGAMSDPWTPAEREIELTKRCLEVLKDFSWPVHLTTKSDMCIRDSELLGEIAKRSYCCVAFTLTTTDDTLAKKIEPNASPPSQRLKAMKRLADSGVKVGTIMTPILPFIEDGKENILSIITATQAAGGTFNIGFLGMTMRDRQRAYFYKKLDEHFPNVRKQYEREYGESYSCSVPNDKELTAYARKLCHDIGMVYDMKNFSYPEKKTEVQVSFL